MPQNTMSRRNLRRMASEPSFGTEVVSIKVGPRQREFKLHKKLLCSTSPYFRDRLDATPASLSPSTASTRTSSGPPTPPKSANATTNSARGAMMWLSTEVPEMFELFVLWLYQRRAFSSFMEAAIARLDPDSCAADVSVGSHETKRRALHWNLVRLHLFAAKTLIPGLQDASMDALQDLYLRCDWEVSPAFVRFLYADCYAEHAFRMRKWAVAMTAWSIALQGGEPMDEWKYLLENQPVLDHDYNSHLKKMAGSRGANLCIKNPQLRLPANRLKSEERFFGFRQCSFHSHRSAVGEGPCPHDAASVAPAASVDVQLATAKDVPSIPAPAPRPKPTARAKDEMESDESDQGVMSPVSMYIRDGFYLDVS